MPSGDPSERPNLLADVALAAAGLRYAVSGRAAAAAICKAALGRAIPSAAYLAHDDPDGLTIPRLPASFEDYPTGSFGAALGAFLAGNGLRPLQVPDELRRKLQQRHAFSVRYAVLHDSFHVLTGFDTSLAGEMGVWSFVAGQDYSRMHARAHRAAQVVYPMVAPGKRQDLHAADRTGGEWGRRCGCVLAAVLPERLAEPLVTVRASFGLPADGIAPAACAWSDGHAAGAAGSTRSASQDPA